MLVLEWELTGIEPTRDRACYSSPATEDYDPNMPRTNQRAELLAAIYGLEAYVAGFGTMRIHEDATGDEMKTWTITTDSRYVVNGITDWLPRWKVSHLDIMSSFLSLIN